MGEQLVKALASQESLAAAMGLQIGTQTGSAVSNAQYNANAARSAAESAETQSRVNADLIRRQYEVDARELASQQERQAAANQVVALKRGITGGSAEAVMSANAAKDMRNRSRLFYNAALQTGAQSLQAAEQARQLREKARQYDWQATSALVGGTISMGTGMIGMMTENTKGANPNSPVAAANKNAGLTSGGSYGFGREMIGQYGWLGYGY